MYILQKISFFQSDTWRQFRKNKPAYVSFYILIALIIIAILCPVLANERPLYIKIKGKSYFPAISFKNYYEIFNKENGGYKKLRLDVTDWKKIDYESVIWAPVVYSPGRSDKNNRYLNSDYKGPGDEQLFVNSNEEILKLPGWFRHWLGTGKKGDDILAGLIHGTKISLLIGVISMGIAALLGLLLGALAGYYGDDRLSTTRGSFWMIILGVFIAFYYGFIVRRYNLEDSFSGSGFSILFQFIISILIFVAICVVFYYSGKLIEKIPGLNTRVNVPVDSLISRLIEIFVSIPRLILIVSIAAVVREPSIIYVMVIIGFTSWTGIARFTRAEFLRIRELEYMEAGKALGYSEKRLIVKHALPNSLAPTLIAVTFGIASAILIESGLSFLGIGVPDDIVTWGTLLSAGKENFDAWWLVVFPGLAIFLTVTIYNLIGEGLRDALDPKLKS